MGMTRNTYPSAKPSLVPVRRVLAVVVSTMALLAACGGGGSGSPTADPPMEKPPRGERIDVQREVAAGTGGDLGFGWYVARTEQEYRVIGGGPAADFSRVNVVKVSTGTGCAEPQDAWLYADGDRLTMRRDLGYAYEECYAPFRMTAVFQVPRDKMPAQPLLGSAPPEDVGVGVLVAKRENVDAEPSNPPTRTLAVTDWTTLQTWARGFGVDDVLQGSSYREPRPGERRFAFLVPACAPAVPRVDLAPDGSPVVSVHSFTTPAARPCNPRMHFLLVYDVPATPK